MKKPFVIMISEITVDGKLTLKRGVSSKIIMTLMDKKINKFFHEERAKADAIMVGSNTIRIDNSILTVRYIKGKNPIRVIPCSKGDLNLDFNIFNKDAKTIIAVSNSAPKNNIEKIKKKGAEVIIAGDKKVDLKILLDKLYNIGVRRLMFEGGPTIAWSMIKNKLIDKIKLINMPFIVGGRNTPSLIEGEGVNEIEKVIHTELTNYFMCGNQLITEYNIIYNKYAAKNQI